jgi:hypothetical protein
LKSKLNLIRKATNPIHVGQPCVFRGMAEIVARTTIQQPTAVETFAATAESWGYGHALSCVVPSVSCFQSESRSSVQWQPLPQSPSHTKQSLYQV